MDILRYKFGHCLLKTYKVIMKSDKPDLFIIRLFIFSPPKMTESYFLLTI